MATASLELGIDVGPVELVCQIGSPRAIGTFLQRVGRANHHRDGTPAGRLYPTTRDELVECTALLAAVREGRLDLLEPPIAPLDVLTQQLVAEVASTDERDVEAMWAMTRHAAPYAELSRRDFDDVVALASWGIETGRGRRGAHLHLDAVNGRLRARRGARLAALTGGGAIPETGDYRVVLDPDGVTVGSVHEDFAVEATAGDIFLLGTHSWRVAKVEVGTVRVHDAGDLPPTIPFWLGEAPARTAELSEAVSELRAALEPLLAANDGDGARQLVQARAGVSAEVAQQVVAYCAAGLAALGHLPTRERLVVERCFDDSEGSQLIIHAPFGGRINRALGLALRKRFCVSFDFELQAAADDDTVVLSLGPQHSFPLTRVQSMLSSAKASEVLTQAVLPIPCSGRVGAGTSTAPSCCRACRAASAGRSISSAWRPTTCSPPCGPAWPPVRRTRRPDPWACPTTCWPARPSTTACTRASPSRGWSSCGAGSSRAPSRCTRSSRRSPLPSPTPS